MTRQPRNLAPSVHAKLLLRAREHGEDFQLTLQRYAVERLLFRLTQSPYHGRFILKGAMLYVVWGKEVYRPTRDLDLLGYMSAEVKPVAECFQAICSMEVEADGLDFLAHSVTAEEIRANPEYGGVQVRIEARLGTAQIQLRVDIGFGDAMTPEPVEVDFPTLLGGIAPRIRAYPRESVIAEKLHAAVSWGEANTRMKDFYDLFVLPRLFPFEGLALARAISATFERRHMPLAASLPLRAAFFEDDPRPGLWRSYLERNKLETAPSDFTAVGQAIHDFLAPPYEALAAGIDFAALWPRGGPWQ